MKTKLKSVLIVSDFYPNHELNDSGGGIARYNEFICQGLSSYNIETNIITFGNKKSIKKINDNLTLHRIDNSRFKRLNGFLQRKFPITRYYYYLYNSFLFYSYFRKNLSHKNIDVIEFSDINTPGFFFRNYAIPQIIRMHCSCMTLYDIYKTSLSDTQKKTWNKTIRLEKKWFSKIQNYSFISNFLLNEFKSLTNFKNFNHTIIPNPIDIDEFSYKNEIKNNEYFTIVTTDRLEYRKGMDMVLKLINDLDKNYPKIPKVEFLIHGENRFKDITNLFDIKSATNNNLKVTLLGNCTKTQIINNFHKADLFLAPSRYENYPYLLIEAMSCGLPVLAANDHAYNEIVTNENGWFYQQDDLKSMTKALINILNLEDEILLNKGFESRKYVQNKAAIDIVIPKTISFYQEILNKVD